MMRFDDVEAEAQGLNDEISQNRCMDPKEASRQQSLDFLQLIIAHCEVSRDAIQADMNKDGE